MNRPLPLLSLSFLAFVTTLAGLWIVLLLPAAVPSRPIGYPDPAPPPLARWVNGDASAAAPGAMVEMTVKDVVPIAEADAHAVMLISEDAQVVLPIFVDEEAAISIAFRLAHQPAPRPLSADLLDHLVLDMGGKVTEVRIEDMSSHSYRGRVFIQQGDRKLQLNAAPSDSIAMALSSGARILVSRKVMAAAGITQKDIDDLRKGQGPGVGGSGQGPRLPNDSETMHRARPGDGPEVTL